MKGPTISCIMPTADRHKFIPLALSYFLQQDYPDTELIIVDDGATSVKELIPDHPKISYYYSEPIGTIGLKRNFACQKARGEYIAHWDDDDYYAPDWLSRNMKQLSETGADISGLNRVVFYSPHVNKRWMYEDIDEEKPWLCGATMVYKKSVWEQHHFIDIQVGEDYDFIYNSNAKITAMDYIGGFVAVLHSNNTSIKPVENLKHKKKGMKWVEPQNETEP